MNPNSSLGYCHESKHTPTERTLAQKFNQAFEESPLPLAVKLQNFPRHVRRQDISRFLVKYEIFKLAVPVHGSVVECGVFTGGGLSAWLHFSSILEPYNHSRRVIGFDTFTGFPDIHESDTKTGSSEHLIPGGLETTPGIMGEIESLMELHDQNRPLGHIPKVELVAGDAEQTIPDYLESHPHLLISLLYLDFDIYKPTKVALEHLFKRVVKGGVIAFDELNCPEFPGETIALLETLGLDQVELKRFPFDPYISYFIK